MKVRHGVHSTWRRFLWCKNVSKNLQPETPPLKKNQPQEVYVLVPKNNNMFLPNKNMPWLFFYTKITEPNPNHQTTKPQQPIHPHINPTPPRNRARNFPDPPVLRPEELGTNEQPTGKFITCRCGVKEGMRWLGTEVRLLGSNCDRSSGLVTSPIYKWRIHWGEMTNWSWPFYQHFQNGTCKVGPKPIVVRINVYIYISPFEMAL